MSRCEEHGGVKLLPEFGETCSICHFDATHDAFMEHVRTPEFQKRMSEFARMMRIFTPEPEDV